MILDVCLLRGLIQGRRVRRGIDAPSGDSQRTSPELADVSLAKAAKLRRAAGSAG